MKTAFVLSLAAVLGLVPLSVLSFEAFVGFYTAAGVLALAVHDYRQTRSPRRRIERRPAARPVETDGVTPYPASTWSCQTLS